MPRTAIVADPDVTKHETGPGHPEQPARFLAVRDRLASSGLLDKALQVPARSATDDELALVHPRSYIELVEREVAQNRRQLSTGDTAIGPHSAAAASLAVGSALTAVDAVFTRKSTNAFSVARPPGHHASSARGMGFCLFNSIAVTARYAQSKYAAKRIAIA